MVDWSPEANALFVRAVKIPSPERRMTFLDEACPRDSALRDEVDRLLKAHEEAGDFLERPLLGDRQTQEMFGSTGGDDRPDPRSDPISLDFLEPSDSPESLGQLGPYKILDVAGRGGMGVVLQAHDPKLNRVVAIKVLAPGFAANPTARRRFLREARAAAAINHPHVVTIHAVEEADRTPYLVMEYVDGLSLQDKIERAGALRLTEILRIGEQIAEGLSAAHAHGLIHRDVKPGNILLENGVERVKITDFGLARAVDDVGMTHTGEVAGTPYYMSPEQARGHVVDHRSDLFSLGSVLYTMCTGRPPFRAESTVAALHRVCDDEPRPIREVNPEIPRWMVDIVQRLLAKRPDDRFLSASEVVELLGRHLAHLQDPESTPFPDRLPVSKRHPRGWIRRRASWLSVTLALLAVLVSLAITEATGFTNLAATVIRIATGEGTLVIELDDPTVQLSLDGEELSIAGAGFRELKLRPGQYQFLASRDGDPVKQELVTITRGGRQVVTVGLDVPAISVEADTKVADHISTPEGAITQVARLESEFDLNYWVNDLAFSPNDGFLLCGRASQVVEVWDVESEQRISITPVGSKLAVSAKGDVVATGYPNQGRVTLSSLNDLAEIRVFVPKEPLAGKRIRTVSLSPDDRYVACGSDDCAALVWDISTGREVHRFACDRKCWVAEFSPDGRSVLVGNYTLRLLEVESGKEVWRVNLAAFTPVATFSPCGRWLMIASENQLRLLDAVAGEEVRRFEGHTELISSARFLPDSRHVVSGSEDRTMRLWNVETGREIARLTAGNQFTKRVAVSPDGRHAASGGGQFAGRRPTGGDGDYDIRVWRLPESVWPKEVNEVLQQPTGAARPEVKGPEDS